MEAIAPDNPASFPLAIAIGCAEATAAVALEQDLRVTMRLPLEMAMEVCDLQVARFSRRTSSDGSRSNAPRLGRRGRFFDSEEPSGAGLLSWHLSLGHLTFFFVVMPSISEEFTGSH